MQWPGLQQLLQLQGHRWQKRPSPVFLLFYREPSNTDAQYVQVDRLMESLNEKCVSSLEGQKDIRLKHAGHVSSQRTNQTPRERGLLLGRQRHPSCVRGINAALPKKQFQKNCLKNTAEYLPCLTLPFLQALRNHLDLLAKTFRP